MKDLRTSWRTVVVLSPRAEAAPEPEEEAAPAEAPEVEE